MRTILVTGALGFIGSNLVPKLLKSGFKVIGIDNLTNAGHDSTTRMKREAGEKLWPNFNFYKLDVRDFDVIKTVTINHQPEAIIHLAAVGSVPRSFADPLNTIKNNDVGFVSIMQLAASIGIEKVVYASSSSVYGSNNDPLRNERHVGHALSPYALSKQMNEMFATIWGPQTGIETTGLRFFNVYGPGQKADSAYSAVIPRFICEKNPRVNGDGSIVRDFTYVVDVCEAIMRALYTFRKSFVVNVGTGNPVDLNYLLSLLNKQKSAVYVDSRPGDVKSSIADTALSEKLLNWKARYHIGDGLMETIAYYKSIGAIASQGVLNV